MLFYLTFANSVEEATPSILKTHFLSRLDSILKGKKEEREGRKEDGERGVNGGGRKETRKETFLSSEREEDRYVLFSCFFFSFY